MSQAPSVAFAGTIGESPVELPTVPSAVEAAAVEAAAVEAAAVEAANVSLRGTTRGLEILITGTPTVAALGARLSELLAEAPAFFAGSDARVSIDGVLPVGALACLEDVAARFELRLVEIGPASQRRRRPDIARVPTVAEQAALAVRPVSSVRPVLPVIAPRLGAPALVAEDAAARPRLAEGSGRIGDEIAAAATGADAATSAGSPRGDDATTASAATPDASVDASPAVIAVRAAASAMQPVRSEAGDAAAEANASAELPARSAACEVLAAAPIAEPSLRPSGSHFAADGAANVDGDGEAQRRHAAAIDAGARTSPTSPETDPSLMMALASLLASIGARQAEAPAAAPAPDEDAPSGPRLVVGPVRSGRIVDHAGHLIVIGDVNPGAEVRAEGSIIVLGRLRGVAHAAIGREAGCIIALSLQPQQLRIGRMVARAADTDRPSGAAEIAYATGETIVVERFLGRLPRGLAASM